MPTSVYVIDRNNVNFMTYRRPLNYFERVLIHSAPPKFVCQRMHLHMFLVKSANSSILFVERHLIIIDVAERIKASAHSDRSVSYYALINVDDPMYKMTPLIPDTCYVKVCFNWYHCIEISMK